MQADFLSTFETRAFKRGETIADPNAATRYLYYIESGSASLELYTSTGRQGSSLCFHAGDFLGETELLTDYPYPASTITARSDCAIRMTTVERARARLNTDIQFAQMLLRNMAEKMLVADKSNLLRYTATVRERLVVALAQHHRDGTLPQLSKEQLASEIATPVRSLNRALKALAGVACYRRGFAVLDAAALSRMAQSVLEGADSGISNNRAPHG